MLRHGSSTTAPRDRDPVPPPAEPCPRCGARDWSRHISGSEGTWLCHTCWTKGRYHTGGTGRRSALTKGEPMAGVAFDPENNPADAAYYRDARNFPPTPRHERGTRRGTDAWAHLSTAQLAQELTAGLCHRAMPGTHPCRDAGIVGLSLLEMGRTLLRRKGISELNGNRVAMLSLRAAQSYLVTDDFTSVLLNLARASLTQGYTVAPRTFTNWCRQTTLPDFRQMNRIALGAGPTLAKVPQHGEYQRAAWPSRAETIQLETWGKIIAFSRQAMINDDLGVLARLTQGFGFSAASMEGDVVYGLLLANPVMSDGNALFSAAHGNLMTASAIDLPNMELARLAMRTQTSPEGMPLNLTPSYLIVGPKQEVAALQLTASIVVPTTLGTAIPVALKSVEVVVDARITDLSWYLAANSAAIDTIEYARLEGVPEGPQLEARDGFDVDGLEIKAREDFGACVLDWRGMVRNPGA
jgi:phage major head subunit gpT-like protein